MTDIIDSKRRSALMAGIRGRDTAPEVGVRRIAHRMGMRFRLHRKNLPGRPDLVIPETPSGRVCPRMLLASTRGMPARFHPQVPDRILDGKVRGQCRPRRAPGSGLEGTRMAGPRHLGVRNQTQGGGRAQAVHFSPGQRGRPSAGKHPLGRGYGTTSSNTGRECTDASPLGSKAGWSRDITLSLWLVPITRSGWFAHCKHCGAWFCEQS